MECVFGSGKSDQIISLLRPSNDFPIFRAKAQFLSIIHKTPKDSVVLLCHWPLIVSQPYWPTYSTPLVLPASGLSIDHSLCLTTLPPDIYMLAPSVPSVSSQLVTESPSQSSSPRIFSLLLNHPPALLVFLSHFFP